MIQTILFSVIVVGMVAAIIWVEKPVYVEGPQPGAVVFDPAPATGSDTYLGSITGTPGAYWDYATSPSRIPGGMVSTMSMK